MKKRTLRFLGLGLIALFCTHIPGWADPTTQPQIEIRLAGYVFSQGAPVPFSCVCGCSHACGSLQPGDDIYLHRLASGWGRMGEWRALGRMTGGTGTTNYRMAIPNDIQPAEDYVITIWNGDDTCWGRSHPFAIRRPGTAAPAGGAEILYLPRGGETLYRGHFTQIRWHDDAGWAPCKVELLKAGTFHKLLKNRALDSLNWMVGSIAVWDIGNTLPTRLRASPFDIDDGADYQIRLNQLDSSGRPTGASITSGMFTIATPTLQVSSPAAGATFRCGQDAHIAWRAEHMPENAKFNIIAFFKKADGTDLVGSCRLVSVPSVASNFHGNSIIWRIPLPGNDHLPAETCFPISCTIKVRWAIPSVNGAWERVFAHSSRFTITSR